MSKITFESNYGNFDYRLEAQAPDGGSDFLMKQGLANLAYRVCGSSVDKALGIKDRKSVAFSDADGERINAAVSAKITELEAKENGALRALKLSFSVTGEHEFGGAAPELKFRDARLIAGKWESAGTLEQKLKTLCEYSGDMHAEDGEDYSRDALAAIHKYWTAYQKAQMAGI